MLDPQEKEIDGTVFQYHPLTLKASRALFDKLAQRFGPAIASAIEGLNSAQIEAGMEFTETLGGLAAPAGGLLRGLASGLDPAFHAEVADTLARKTLYQTDDGKFAQLEPVREALLGVMMEAKLIGWCLSVQYADFLAPLRDLSMQAVSLRGMAVSALESRRGSTGSPIASPSPTNTATA